MTDEMESSLSYILHSNHGMRLILHRRSSSLLGISRNARVASTHIVSYNRRPTDNRMVRTAPLPRACQPGGCR